MQMHASPPMPCLSECHSAARASWLPVLPGSSCAHRLVFVYCSFCPVRHCATLRTTVLVLVLVASRYVGFGDDERTACYKPGPGRMQIKVAKYKGIRVLNVVKLHDCVSASGTDTGHPIESSPRRAGRSCFTARATSPGRFARRCFSQPSRVCCVCASRLSSLVRRCCCAAGHTLGSFCPKPA